MKILICLIFVGVSYSVPFYSYESRFGIDSSSFESLEIALTDDEDWREAALERMNSHRKKAGLPPYDLDETLNKLSQSWAEQNACTGLKHDDIDIDFFFAENLAGLNTLITGDDKSKMAVDGVQRWYDEVKDYDCRKMPQSGGDMAYYYKVGHYMNNMNKRFNVVGFGLAMCPGKSTGQLVARFNGKDGYTMKIQDEEMKRQGITYENFMKLDASKFVPCPKDFEA